MTRLERLGLGVSAVVTGVVVAASLATGAGPAAGRLAAQTAVQAQQAGGGTPGQRPVFRGGVNFVSVDAYPRRDGQIVEGLRKEDFRVFEDGTPQAIETFEFVRSEPNVPDAARRDPSSQAEGDQLAADPHRRVFVVYLDLAHTTVPGSHAAEAPVLEFLNRTIGPDDLFAVMTAETPVGQMVFGQRTETIESELERYWTWGQADRIVVDRTPLERRLMLCETADNPGLGATLVQLNREDALQTSLENLMMRLRDLRDERTNVLFISEGWVPQSPRPQPAAGSGDIPSIGLGSGSTNHLSQASRDRQGNADRSWCDGQLARLSGIDFAQRFRQMLAAAERANVALYPVDVGGLSTSINHDRTDTLRTMAENTDGRAIVGTNDLEAGVREIAKDLSGYYLLGYYSTDAKADGRYRTIKVEVTKPGVTVAARRGYLAPTAGEMAARAEAAAGPTPVDLALGRLAAISPHVQLFGYGRATPGTVTVVAELGENAAADASWHGGADVQVTVTGADGAEATAPARIAPGARGVLVHVARADVHGGPWQATIRATGADGGRLDTRLDIAASGATLIGEPVAWRGTPSPRIPLRPVADLEFRRTERLHIEWPVLGAIESTQARLLDRHGKPLGSDLHARDASRARRAGRRLAHRRVPGRRLPGGTDRGRPRAPGATAPPVPRRPIDTDTVRRHQARLEGSGYPGWSPGRRGRACWGGSGCVVR